MTMRRMALAAATLAALALGFASPANAQATRTWVSGVGDDVNPCSRTAPCKTFAGAISKTAAGGEISVLDPGGYGPVTITKSITIDGAGTNASILSVGSNGITVNGAGITVNLRNLQINGAGTTTGNGIRIVQAAAVNVDNVTIMNITGNGTDTNGRGIAIETATANVRVSVVNSNILNMGRYGIHSAPTAGNVFLNVERANIQNGFVGVQVRQLTNAVISNSFITGNLSGSGVTGELTGAIINISNTVLSNNGYGIYSGNGGAPTIRVYGSTITGNTIAGIQIVAGQVISLGNNFIRGNTGNEAPSSTVPTT